MRVAIEAPERARWIDGALVFTGANLASTDAGKIGAACTNNSEITIEMWVQADNHFGRGPARSRST